MKKLSTFVMVCMLIVTTHTFAQHSEKLLIENKEVIPWWFLFPLIGIFFMLTEYFFHKHGLWTLFVSFGTLITATFLKFNFPVMVIGILISGVAFAINIMVVSKGKRISKKILYIYCFLMIAYMALVFFIA